MVALEAFTYQMEHNPAYRAFASAICASPSNLEEIPFLPIQFFKNQRIYASEAPVEMTFKSSSTTGQNRSVHELASIDLYHQSFEKAFDAQFPNVPIILALLPSYLEQGESSLIYMVDQLISRREKSGYWLQELERLPGYIGELLQKGEDVLLFGVSYALLDLAELGPFNFPSLKIMETGGMKGRRVELIREELHEKLCRGFGVEQIHSEYGMTELLSQAYSRGRGLFVTPPWMKVLTRDTTDPLSYLPNGRTGGLNIIDLANWYSCPFIATDDLGRIHPNGQFEVLGRFDHSDVRGCNLLVG